MSLALGLMLSLVIGVSLGMLGGGGSILTVPMLVYVLRLDAKPAIATSLIVVGLTSAAAMVPHARAGRVDIRIGGTFGAASMAGAFVGGRLAHHLPSKGLLVAFGVMMLVTGLAMMRGRKGSHAAVGRPAWGRVLAIGVAVGVLTGVVGAGGGFVIVPALALFCGLPMPKAVATSLFVIAINSLAGFAGYISSVQIDARLAAVVTSLAIVGSVLGATLAGRVKQDTLRRAFAWLVLAMSVFIIARETTLLLGMAAFAVAAAALLHARVPASSRVTRRAFPPPSHLRLVRPAARTGAHGRVRSSLVVRALGAVTRFRVCASRGSTSRTPASPSAPQGRG